MAMPLMWTRQADTLGVLGLALNAADSRSNGYQEVTEQIRELLETGKVLWAEAMQIEDETRRWQEIRAAFRLLHLADILSVTTHV
jgi:hypothetical protein